jgi:hypothetical protein
MPLTSRLTVPTTSWAGTRLGERPSGGRPGFGFSPAALRWCLETRQRVSMGEQPRSARTGRLPLSLTMHHAILPFLDYRLAQWNSRCSRPVVLPSKFAVLTGSRVLAALCVAVIVAMAIWTRNVPESLCGSYCGCAKNAARSIRRAQGLIGYRRRGGVLKRRHSRPLPESALPFLTSSPCSATSSPGLSPCLLSLMTDSANLPLPWATRTPACCVWVC